VCAMPLRQIRCQVGGLTDLEAGAWVKEGRHGVGGPACAMPLHQIRCQVRGLTDLEAGAWVKEGRHGVGGFACVRCRCASR